MAAPVRIEDEAFSDLRYDVLAKLCHLADADHARGKMAVLWRQCTARTAYVLPASMVASVLGENGASALVESGLGEEHKDGIRIRGTKGRIEWLAKLRKNAKKGGIAKAAKRQAEGKQVAAKSLPSPCPPTPTLSTSEEEKNPRASRTPSGPHQRAMHELAEFFARTHQGNRCTLTERHGAGVKRILSQHGLPEFMRRIHIAETAPPSFPPAPYTPQQFLDGFDSFATPAQPKQQTLSRFEPPPRPMGTINIPGVLENGKAVNS